MKKSYRQNVAMVILNSQGKILACERSDVPGAWQLPQGGIDPGENPEDAMWRELEEEIGTRELDLISKLPSTILYNWPEHLYSRGYHGQEQHYFLLRIKDESQINLDTEEKEFSNYEWLGSNEFLSRVNGFKKEAYVKAINEFIKSTSEIYVD